MKGLLINAIAAAVEAVSAAIEERAAEKAARAEMHDFCDSHGYHVTPIMDAHASSFMETINKYRAENRPVKIKYRNFPVTIERSRRRARTNWTHTFDTKTGVFVITVHSGKVNF
jgi:hypothetical protein